MLIVSKESFFRRTLIFIKLSLRKSHKAMDIFCEGHSMAFGCVFPTGCFFLLGRPNFSTKTLWLFLSNDFPWISFWSGKVCLNPFLINDKRLSGIWAVLESLLCKNEAFFAPITSTPFVHAKYARRTKDIWCFIGVIFQFRILQSVS